MDIIFSASIIASFLAGMVALFAPCCITVLLPAYLASAFREKRNVLKMTFVFFAGIAVVLLPIGLGAAWLADIFKSFHKELYIFGGLFMLLLAIFSIAGKGVSIIPMPKRLKISGFDARHPKSVFLLGMFSGAATSCCAPVLAGAVTLAVLSGVFWKAVIVIFSYIFGMTFPLFIAAYYYDKFKLEQSRFIKGRILEVKLPAFLSRGDAAETLHVHSTNLLSGAVFSVMGTILLVLGFSGNAFWSPEMQAKIGNALNGWSQNALEILMKAPNILWGSVIMLFFAFFLYRAIKEKNDVPEEKFESKEEDDGEKIV